MSGADRAEECLRLIGEALEQAEDNNNTFGVELLEGIQSSIQGQVWGEQSATESQLRAVRNTYDAIMRSAR